MIKEKVEVLNTDKSDQDKFASDLEKLINDRQESGWVFDKLKQLDDNSYLVMFYHDDADGSNYDEQLQCWSESDEDEKCRTHKCHCHDDDVDEYWDDDEDLDDDNTDIDYIDYHKYDEDSNDMQTRNAYKDYERRCIENVTRQDQIYLAYCDCYMGLHLTTNDIRYGLLDIILMLEEKMNDKSTFDKYVTLSTCELVEKMIKLNKKAQLSYLDKSEIDLLTDFSDNLVKYEMFVISDDMDDYYTHTRFNSRNVADLASLLDSALSVSEIVDKIHEKISDDYQKKHPDAEKID